MNYGVVGLGHLACSREVCIMEAVDKNPDVTGQILADADIPTNAQHAT
jgi:hypothetical protein